MNRPPLANSGKRGAALIIVLAFVVLLSGLVVAYLSRTTGDRQLAHGTFSENRADVLARSALDVVVGDLRQEINTGSTVTTVNGYTVYIPTPSTNIVPMQAGTPSPTPTPCSNMIRRSVYPELIVSPGVSSRASAVNSTANSLNSRSVTKARWNKHYLIPRISPTPSAVSDTTPMSTFTAPDWVLVTRNGPTSFSGWDSNVKDATATNTNYVVGRYAYAIYDEGGLLDVNVAGFPHVTPTPASTPPVQPQPVYAPSPPYAPGSYPAGYSATTYTAQQIGRKGSPALADLSVLPAAYPPPTPTSYFPADQINKLVGWRNYATIQNSGGLTSIFNFDSAGGTRYLNYARSVSSDFLNVSSSTFNNATDQRFTSRQELLSFNQQTGFSVAVLQYLSTFSREYNRTSWKPASPTAINPDLSAIRVTSPFTRIDGTSAVVGEPLFKTRFPLRRLCWLTYKGPSALRTLPPTSPVLTATSPDYDMWQLMYVYGIPQSYLQQGTPGNILKAFGLVWDSRAYQASPRQGQQWVYDSPSSANSGGTFDGTTGTAATVIKNLTTVQSEGREPDFFELLKAVILNGSVGLGTNADTFIKTNGKYYDTTNGKSADYQLLQIGANIIDEWDTDNIPASIGFAGNEAIGIENLPYLNKLVFCAAVPKSDNSQGPLDAWLVPSLWNPHQNASSAPSTGAGSRVRIALTGSPSYTAGFVVSTNPPYTTNPIVTSPTPTIDVAANGFLAALPPQDPAPAPLATAGAVTSVNDGTGPEKYYGFHFVFATRPTASQVNRDILDTAYPDFGSTGTGNLELQVQLPDGTYRTYQKWIITAAGHPLTAQVVKKNGDWTNTNKMVDPEYVALDPRTLRFGVWGSDASGQGNNPGSASIKKDASYGAEDSIDQSKAKIELINWSKPQGAQFTVTPVTPSDSPGADLSLYATNGTAADSYVDLDGVQRHGDWTTDNNGTGNKKTIMYASAGGNYLDRPQILSSPFQSVAELGQVFRDQPWKTLAFTLTNSGDAGLLDVFSLQEVSSTAGRISLNTHQYPVLSAVLSQVTKQISGGGVIPTGSSDQTVNNIARALVSITSTNPLVSKGELVTKLTGDPSVVALANKEAREAVMRALSDAGQTRTWNLMIDLVAQSGRYPPAAGALADFIVEGEKRYWLHIAIDRFTGEVIDQQLEAVYE